jgi:hypothetical protein
MRSISLQDRLDRVSRDDWPWCASLCERGHSQHHQEQRCIEEPSGNSHANILTRTRVRSQPCALPDFRAACFAAPLGNAARLVDIQRLSQMGCRAAARVLPLVLLVGGINCGHGPLSGPQFLTSVTTPTISRDCSSSRTHRCLRTGDVAACRSDRHQKMFRASVSLTKAKHCVVLLSILVRQDDVDLVALERGLVAVVVYADGKLPPRGSSRLAWPSRGTSYA